MQAGITSVFSSGVTRSDVEGGLPSTYTCAVQCGGHHVWLVSTWDVLVQSQCSLDVQYTLTFVDRVQKKEWEFNFYIDCMLQ